MPKPILRSRNNSVGTSEGEAAATGSGAGTRSSSPEGGSGMVKSILKRSSRAAAAAEDLGDSSEAAGVAVECLSGGTSGATSRSSPEPPHGILKQRKWSVGSAGIQSLIETMATLETLYSLHSKNKLITEKSTH